MWTVRQSFLPSIAATLLMLSAAGCVTAPKEEPVAPLTSDVSAPAQTPPSHQPIASEPSSSKTSAWPYLFLSADDIPRDQRAVSAKGLVVSKEELAATKVLLPHTADELELELLALHHLQSSGLMDDPKFQAHARASLRALLAELVRDHETDYADEVDPATAYQRYIEEAGQYERPEFASIRLIQVPTSAAADEALKRLASGEEFSKVAAAVSLHASRAKGGEIEPFSPGTYNADIEELAFQLAPGELGTVNTSGGVYIIEKIASTPASTIPFEEVKAQIEEQLRAEARAAALKQFEEKLRNAPGGTTSRTP